MGACVKFALCGCSGVQENCRPLHIKWYRNFIMFKRKGFRMIKRIVPNGGTVISQLVGIEEGVA